MDVLHRDDGLRPAVADRETGVVAGRHEAHDLERRAGLDVVDAELAAGKTLFLDWKASWCSTCAAQGRVLAALKAKTKLSLETLRRQLEVTVVEPESKGLFQVHSARAGEVRNACRLRSS